ncbi:MAG: acylneuraminate cytidylyltransferase family protein [Myxococcales bacterium]|nr:acylneuraminate cytidylyltransferase family protein [Myxococcales bacterium]
MNERVAIIPARGGSKGLPGKNLRELAGRPLIAHTIAAALESAAFARVVVSSEDPAILEAARTHGAETLERPPELASDTASSLDVLSHALHELAAEGERYALLQPTSPLRNATHILEAIEAMSRRGAASLVSVTENRHPPHRSLVLDPDGQAQPLFDWADLTRPRQLLPKTYHPNGAIYLGEAELYLKDQNLFAAPLALYEMSEEASIDIDVEADLDRAARVFAADCRV